ncbi:hypothetical protein BVRB_8g189670 [Beta vulgaris subsp. vulgaris]|uniref:uncharacterized protein LOC104901465 n=1 Tax=Beta vulgaris subsp. vulgaris TaxID=3555 RepID=UPI00053FAC19|nr:uncharacterized protein LOC104901465 [Beta vulgaris subsp. vulgaris]KMT03823.1 hypothetical protein BVRB_8g189670 [Beta vulgaris subsp. vulgaris]
MVVCKCRKATKLYCFVHKVPVCGECICFPEHQICVVRTYSEWVIDGEYDWPPNCGKCNAVLDEGTDPQTTRLGCLHVIHTNCLISHIKSFPPHTAPAGYVCPACSSSIWPPKNFKDSGSHLHSKLKEAVLQTGLEKNVFGSHHVSVTTPDRGPPPAFSSDPLKRVSGAAGPEAISGVGIGSSTHDIVEIEGTPGSSNHESNYITAGSPASAGATTRKGTIHVDRQNSEISYFADDEDGNRKKYTRRGPFRHKFLRALLPFWSTALPTLPVTAPSRKDSLNADDVAEGRVRHQRSSRMDPRKILLFIAIMACMATMGILYYRLAQGSFGQEMPNDEQ